MSMDVVSSRLHIEGDFYLVDTPVTEEMSLNDARIRLERMRDLEGALHTCAHVASDLGLSVTWIKIEGADDFLDMAIASVGTYIRHMERIEESKDEPAPKIGGFRERVRGTAALIQENNNDR